VDGTDYHFYDLGIVQFPPQGRQTDLMKCAMQIDAERTVGLGKLNMDRLTRIPCDEGFAYANSPTGTAGSFILRQYADGRTGGMGISADGSGTPIYNIEYTIYGGMPTGTVYGYMAAEGTEGAALGYQSSITIMAYGRWSTLRGASGE